MNAPPSPAIAERLATPLQFLKGVGPARAELLARLGLRTVRDLLFCFPRDYQDLTDFRSIAALEEDRLQSVRGVVEDVDSRGTSSGKSILGVLVREGGNYLRCIWFNQPYLREKFQCGQHLIVSGRMKLQGPRWETIHPNVQWIEAEEETPAGRLLPIYPLTEGLNQGQVRSLTRSALDAYAAELEEVFPERFREEHGLWPLQRALTEIHFPADKPSLESARRRFVYQELFILQLALALRKQVQETQQKAAPLLATAKIDARVRRLFPFTFTAAQEQAIREVAADLNRSRPMNRLLQGDVGSGKTVVAVYAILLAVAHGYQAALMAPTEVLARQHARTLGELLAQSQVRTGLLTGGMPARERQQTLDRLRGGELDVLIGTQAIISGGVQFAKLALVVIDEQHKFGVRQRATLRQAGVQPHYLVMTATPIPRTVAMTQYGDLDVTTIRESPPGRQNLYTYLPSLEQRPQWWEFVRKKLREGRQAYVVAPLVEETEAWESANLNATFEELANGELADFRLGMVHGRMSASEKEAAMTAFHLGETQVLAATSVVEVGVDVPNATLMTILGAERFGLSQLHQLRGRIHRGAHPGYCCLFADPKNDEAKARLEAVAASTDGFELAEKDFELRGPGDLLGTRQHGLPPLRIADLRRDRRLVEEARRAAQAFVAADPGLAQGAHGLLRRMVLARYGKALELGDVG